MNKNFFNPFAKAPTLEEELAEVIEAQLRVTITKNLDRIDAEYRALAAQSKLDYIRSVDTTYISADQGYVHMFSHNSSKPSTAS